MSNSDIVEPKRIQTELFVTTNPLGDAVANFVLAFNDAVGRSSSSYSTIKFRAFRVENDQRFSDHILIDGTHRSGEEAGSSTTHQVVIHTAPKGFVKHTVRFLNFGREEEKRDAHFGQVGELVQDIISYITTGDIRNE